ncbi:MAG: VanZ family protein [Candidatus Omnitrophota bacterium]
MRNIVKYWLPLYFYAALIFYLSSLSRPLPETNIINFDKFAHAVEYFIFGFLAARALKNSSLQLFRQNFKIIAILFAVAYGVSDELHQHFVPMRQFSVFDMICDGIGGIMGVLIHGRHPSV